MSHHLVGTHEIAQRLGVSRQRVDELSRGPDFPQPAVSLATGRVWESSAIDEWTVAGRRSAGRPRRAADDRELRSNFLAAVRSRLAPSHPALTGRAGPHLDKHWLHLGKWWIVAKFDDFVRAEVLFQTNEVGRNVELFDLLLSNRGRIERATTRGLVFDDCGGAARRKIYWDEPVDDVALHRNWDPAVQRSAERIRMLVDATRTMLPE